MEREPFSLQDTWQNVAEAYGWMVSLFGAPFAIAQQLILMRKDRRDILQWLGPIEALARRCLLLKALTLPKSNDPPPQSRPGRVLIAFTDRPHEDIDPDSEKWRVRFCVMPHGVLRRKPDPNAHKPAADKRGGGVTYNAIPLARRFEALRRLLQNPDAAVARLARLLATQPEIVGAAFRPYRPRATCVKFALEDAQREIDLALNTS